MAFWEKLRTFLGFKKSYSAVLFCIFAFPFFTFTLSQLVQSFTLRGVRVPQTAPGEMYWFQDGHRRLGISIHLAAILPCAVLAILQFIPAIRQKKPFFHRVGGRMVLVLLLISNIGTLMISRHTFGGSVDIQANLGLLVVSTTVGAAFSYYNVRRHQLDQHRAWTLRTMFYMGTVITARPIFAILSVAISSTRDYRNVWSCDVIDWTWKYYGADNYLQTYPQCANKSGPNAGFVPVLANIFSRNDPAEIGASFQVPAGAAFWIALVLHAVGVEVYLALTPLEATRLRMESYRRQLAAGYKHPGSAGLVPERFGDADPWVYPGCRGGVDGDGIDKTGGCPGSDGTSQNRYAD